ncbi:phage baseplate assembly protein V [uncultured Sutterella sp.]|uniref:phage baseplate assembly protein V n=1 Tax=uncultured Sutterella sp. TaxID=286133 RepID=UPI00266C6861|nr:phage baseplate assembly protein V [uncultured Sutterella sp.]
MDDIMARGVVSAADGAKKMRAVQVRLLADEVRDDLEHVEPYGFTSEPKDDEQPEAFALFFGGDRSHGIVFCVADRRFRLKNMKPGEVAIYDDLGQKVYLTRDGLVIETPGTLTATVAKNATVTVGGNLTAEVAGDAALKASSVKLDTPATTLTGTLTVQGLITGQGGMAISGGSGASVTGDLKTTGDVVAGAISLKTHTHTEQGDGAETSGPH